MFREDRKNRLESLQKNLYSRVPKLHDVSTGTQLKNEHFEANEEWQRGEDEDQEIKYYPRKVTSFSTKMMIFSIIFFLVALGFGFFIYYNGGNVFSTNNIEINVLGPVSIGGGEKLAFEISVRNNNNASLEDVNLKIEYPEGTRENENISSELKRQDELLGDIPSGDEIKKKVNVVLFGEENSKKEIQISLEYRVKNSNAIYEKIKKFEIALTSAPISISINSLSEINSGQDVEFVIDIASNSSSLLKDVVLKGEYPFGFIFKEATPKPSYDQNVWKIGDLKPGEKKKIKLKGQVEGQDGEERVFRFYAGLQSPKDEKSVDPVFLSSTQSLMLKKPFIGVSLVLDGQTSPIYVTELGKEIRGDVVWENNLSSPITDAKIQVKITGNVNKSSVIPSLGFYNSSSNIITWDSGTSYELESLNPGDNGRVSFSFASIALKDVDLLGFKNPEILLSVNVKGKRSEKIGVPEEITSTASAKVRLESNLSLARGISYEEGPFKNTGPIPPMAEKETTYTVTWTVGNSWNDVRDVTVSTTLPPYVRWLNIVSPEGEKITYSPAGGKLVWNVGDVNASGSGSQMKKVSFQVSILPSVSQIGTAPVVINQSVIEWMDRFTNTQLRQVENSLTTKLGDVNSREITDGVVVR